MQYWISPRKEFITLHFLVRYKRVSHHRNSHSHFIYRSKNFALRSQKLRIDCEYSSESRTLRKMQLQTQKFETFNYICILGMFPGGQVFYCCHVSDFWHLLVKRWRVRISNSAELWKSFIICVYQTLPCFAIWFVSIYYSINFDLFRDAKRRNNIKLFVLISSLTSIQVYPCHYSKLILCHSHTANFTHTLSKPISIYFPYPIQSSITAIPHHYRMGLGRLVSLARMDLVRALTEGVASVRLSDGSDSSFPLCAWECPCILSIHI